MREGLLCLFYFLQLRSSLSFPIVEVLCGLVAAHTREVAMPAVVLYPTLILAGFVASFAPRARPTVVVEIVSKKELFDEFGGNVGVGFPRIRFLTVSLPANFESAEG